MCGCYYVATTGPLTSVLPSLHSIKRIEQFETRNVKRKTRATSLEEERIRKLVNAEDLNYLIQLGNSPDYHEMVEYCLDLKRGSFKSCKKIKRR